jgi:hypothetical protein
MILRILESFLEDLRNNEIRKSYSVRVDDPLRWPGQFGHVGRLAQRIRSPTDRPARPHCAHQGGHHGPGAGGGAVRDGSPVDEVWRRRWVKLELEEGEAPGIASKAQAHRSGGATWGRGGAAAR